MQLQLASSPQHARAKRVRLLCVPIPFMHDGNLDQTRDLDKGLEPFPISHSESHLASCPVVRMQTVLSPSL